eukprot:7376077-Prymnesium_polylepis.1
MQGEEAERVGLGLAQLGRKIDLLSVKRHNSHPPFRFRRLEVRVASKSFGRPDIRSPTLETHDHAWRQPLQRRRSSSIHGHEHLISGVALGRAVRATQERAAQTPAHGHRGHAQRRSSLLPADVAHARDGPGRPHVDGRGRSNEGSHRDLVVSRRQRLPAGVDVQAAVAGVENGNLMIFAPKAVMRNVDAR